MFLDGRRWKKEGMNLYDRMKTVLAQAMEDPKVKAAWPEEPEDSEAHCR